MRPLRAAMMLLFLATPRQDALATEPSTLAEVGLTAIDGNPFETPRLEGKVVLVVNVASFCTYTPQYSGLQQLWREYGDKGLLVLGVPCNQFGGQEPGSNREIKNFCSSMYGVTFPLLQKQHVNGRSRSKLYKYLVASKAGGGEDIGWNFEKFLIGKQGEVIARFPSYMSPADPRFLAAIELALAREE